MTLPPGGLHRRQPRRRRDPAQWIGGDELHRPATGGRAGFVPARWIERDSGIVPVSWRTATRMLGAGGAEFRLHCHCGCARERGTDPDRRPPSQRHAGGGSYAITTSDLFFTDPDDTASGGLYRRQPRRRDDPGQRIGGDELHRPATGRPARSRFDTTVRPGQRHRSRCRWRTATRTARRRWHRISSSLSLRLQAPSASPVRLAA